MQYLRCIFIIVLICNVFSQIPSSASECSFTDGNCQYHVLLSHTQDKCYGTDSLQTQALNRIASLLENITQKTNTVNEGYPCSGDCQKMSTKIDGMQDKMNFMSDLLLKFQERLPSSMTYKISDVKGDLEKLKVKVTGLMKNITSVETVGKSLEISNVVLGNRLDEMKKSVDENVRKIGAKLDSLAQTVNKVSQPKNIKQFTWLKMNDQREDGVLKEVAFTKRDNSSSLRISWFGNLRIIPVVNNYSCRRWYFTINNAECSSPAPIDAQIFVSAGSGHDDHHRPSPIDGLCDNIPAGDLKIKFVIGQCMSPYANGGNGDAFTGWQSTSRIIIEEIEI